MWRKGIFFVMLWFAMAGGAAAQPMSVHLPNLYYPYPGFGGAPYASPYGARPQVWNVWVNPATGALESRSMTIDPATGRALVYDRRVARPGLAGPPAVVERVIDPTTGDVRQNRTAYDPFSGNVHSDSWTYQQATGAYEQRQTTYQPSRGSGQTTRQTYDPAKRATSTETSVYDPATGTYYYGGRAGAQPQAAGKGDSPRAKVYVWPPAETEEETSNPPPASDNGDQRSEPPAP
jgi:hypothetical protein